MTALCSFTNCQHKVSTPYHPQTNGLVERFNSTLITGLQKVTNDQADDWDTKIDNFMFAYRTSVQESTKYSPFEIMFNRYKGISKLNYTSIHIHVLLTKEPL